MFESPLNAIALKEHPAWALRRCSLFIPVYLISLSAQHAISEDDAGKLSAITYSQKKEQSIHEVPISVTSYSASETEALQIINLSDLQNISSSLSVNPSHSKASTTFTIRGIGTPGSNPGFDPSIGIFIDGVYRSRNSASTVDLMDIENIEVIKGPQGTLFGRNTSGGVINIRTRKPSTSRDSSIAISTGNQGFQRIAGSSTGSLMSESLSYRLSGNAKKVDGHIKNIVNNDELNQLEHYSFKGQLLWDYDDYLSLRIISDYTKNSDTCCASIPVFFGQPSQLLAKTSGTAIVSGEPAVFQEVQGVAIDPSNRKASYNHRTDNPMTDGGASAELVWDLANNTRLTMLSSHRISDELITMDSDFMPADGIREHVNDRAIDETSVELRLSSTEKQTIDWVGGIYYFKQNIDYRDHIILGSDAHDYIDSLVTQGAATLTGDLSALGFPVPEGTFLPSLLSDLENTNGESYYGAGQFDMSDVKHFTESSAIFGQLTWNVTPRLSFSAGIRYSHEFKEARYNNENTNVLSDLSPQALTTAFQQSQNPLISQFANAPVNGTTGGEILSQVVQQAQTLPRYNDFTADYHDTHYSGNLSVNYELNETMSLFSRLANGYKSGGLNMDRTAPGQTPGNPESTPESPIFEPEEVDSFEVGLKSSLLNNKLFINTTLFYHIFDNLQYQEFTGHAFLSQNEAKVIGKGVELDYKYYLDKNWFFNGELTAQNITYDTFILNSEDLSDNRSIFSPEIKHTGAVTYQNQIANDKLWSATANFSYRSSYETTPNNEALLSQKETLLFNLLLNLSSIDEKWSLQLWGKNITNENYFLSGAPTTLQEGSFHAYINEPRSFGITGEMKF